MNNIKYSKDQLEFICPLTLNSELLRVWNRDYFYVYRRVFGFNSELEQYYLLPGILIEADKVGNEQYRERLAKILKKEFVIGRLTSIYVAD